MSILRFSTLGTENFDLAFYVRVVWGLASGDRVNSIMGAHDLGLHMMPVMTIFAPLCGVLPIAQTLLVAQAIALGAAVPLVFVLGRRAAGRPWAGLALAAAFCLHPSVLQIGCREFHPGSLALPVLVAALDALRSGRIRAGALLLAIACLAREDVALVATGAGLALLLDPSTRRAGAAIAAAGAAWFLVYVLAIQPAYLPAQGSIEAHFAGWGHDAPHVAGHILSHPREVLSRLLSRQDASYLALLLATVAGLPLLGPRWLLPAAPALAINLLSSFPASLDPGSHYVTLALPGLLAASADGIGRLARWKRAGPRAPALACVAIVLASLAGHVAMGATPLSARWSAQPYVMDRNEGLLAWYARTLEARPDLGVLAPAAVIGHLAERRSIYSWAFDHPQPDAAILDLRQRQWVQIDPARWDERMEREIQRTDADPAYGVWRFNPPFRVMWRGVPGGAERLAAVSPGAVPAAAIPQPDGWPGAVDLVALEPSLTIEREEMSGRYNQLYVVRTTFYWKAERPLPADLLLKVVIEGDTKTHVRWYLPTWGVRDTSTWLPGETIRDVQWSTSPGGWPLEALRASVVFVTRGGEPYPPGAVPINLVW